MISEKPKTIQELIPSLKIRDVTRQVAELKKAYRLVAKVYARFASEPTSVDEVYHELCADEYHEQEQANTFVVTQQGTNPSQTDFLATIRLVTGNPDTKNNRLAPLEAMHLMCPVGGWRSLEANGFRPYQSIEFGRLAFAEKVDNMTSSGKQFKYLLCRLLVEGSYFRAANYLGKNQAWAIMPRHVARFVAQSGIPVEEIPDVIPMSDRNRELFEKYDRYWLHSNPRFFRLPFAEQGETYREMSAILQLHQSMQLNSNLNGYAQ